MKIQTFNVGMLSTNCYVVNCPKTQETIIIDPGFDAPHEAEQIVRYMNKNTLKVKFMVNSQGHPGHIRGDSVLKKKYRLPICIHMYDAHRLTDLGENAQSANILLEDEELLKFGKATLKIMHKPGHTARAGSISLVGEKLVFTGDTLFAVGIGRTDLPGGSDHDMRLSLEKLCVFQNITLFTRDMEPLRP